MWMAIGGWLPKGQLASRFEAEAIRRETLAEGIAVKPKASEHADGHDTAAA